MWTVWDCYYSVRMLIVFRVSIQNETGLAIWSHDPGSCKREYLVENPDRDQASFAHAIAKLNRTHNALGCVSRDSHMQSRSEA
jgi:hypothetical protein